MKRERHWRHDIDRVPATYDGQLCAMKLSGGRHSPIPGSGWCAVVVFVASGSLAMNERAGGLKFADDDSRCFAECHNLRQ
jgi:hypothetical protein